MKIKCWRNTEFCSSS